MRRLPFSSVVMVFLVAGCSGMVSDLGADRPDSSLSPSDAGGPSDAGTRTDAGPSPSDAGGPTDAGTSADAGRSDAGLPVDAGRDTFMPCPTGTTACRIMPLGDSITDGVPVGGGYRVELFHLSNADKRAITFVGSQTNGPATVDGLQFPQHHEGHSGYTIDTIGGRSGIYPLVQQSLTTYTPHIVLLMIGTNDVSIGADLANAPKRLGLLLDRITTTSPNALVVVAKLIPSTDDSMNNNVRTYNTGVAQVVEQRVAAGKHLLLVDMYETFTANPSFKTQWMSDWLHPTTDGYAAMARTWYPTIKPFLAPGP